MPHKLVIKDLVVQTDNKTIIDRLNLTIEAGSIHTLMGPNGCGKSTLSLALTGHPKYQIKSGTVKLGQKDILDLDITQRSLAGLMLAWQHPVELPGIKISHFLRLVVNAHRQAGQQKPYSVGEFLLVLRQTMQDLKMKPSLATRNVNDGLSGGEKKRIEILTAILVKPKFLILDEIDSGLDIDAIKVVAKQIKKLAEAGTGILVITHYHRLLDYLIPDRVHIILDGRLIKEGSADLALALENSSYEAITQS